MTQQIDELLDAYWNAAYREGKEGRTHDTPDGKAQAIRSAIEAALKPDPSCDDVKLAEMIMSDCGHSTNNTRLLERITNRIALHTAPPAQTLCGYDETTGNCTSNPCCRATPPAQPGAKTGEPVSEETARTLEVNTRWDGKANVCIHCGKEPNIFYIVTGHDHTDDYVKWCECRKAAPPAQTPPPRLTDEWLEAHGKGWTCIRARWPG